MKTNTDLDKLDEATRNKIINEFKETLDYYYKTELPKQIEKIAKEEVDFKNSINWFSFGFALAILLMSVLVLLFK